MTNRSSLAWELAQHAQVSTLADEVLARHRMHSTGELIIGVGHTSNEAIEDLARKIEEWARENQLSDKLPGAAQ